MKREFAALAMAFLALLLLLNTAPQSPRNASSSPVLPSVKLSELSPLATEALPLALYATPEFKASAANVQVIGVDEEDYVKFDEQNLYVAADGRVYIVDSNLNIKGSVPCPSSDCVVFVWKNSLLVYSRGRGAVASYLYKLPDLSKVAEYSFSGVPVAARMANGVVYIVAVASPREVVINGVEVAEGRCSPSTYLPRS
jgi:Secreted protein containing C-terminal beta-propeller domain distantly related to WD-40 repeats